MDSMTTTTSIKDYGNENDSVNHRLHFDIHGVSNQYHSPYIENFDNTRKVSSGNEKDFKDNYKVEYSYSDDAWDNDNTKHDQSTYNGDRHLDDDGNINVNIYVLVNDIKSDPSTQLMTTTLRQSTEHNPNYWRQQWHVCNKTTTQAKSYRPTVAQEKIKMDKERELLYDMSSRTVFEGQAMRKANRPDRPS